MSARNPTGAKRPEDVLIEALLEAVGARAHASYCFGEYRLDVADQQLFRRDKAVPLPPKEFRLLQLLVEHHGHLVTKQQVLDVVWPDTFVTDDTIAQRVSCLRKALGGDAPRLIETVAKRGYRFVADVRAE